MYSNPVRMRSFDLLEKLMTIEDLCEYLSVSRSTAYEWTHTGFIPHYKLPRGVRFKVAEIDTWLKKRRSRGRVTYKQDISKLLPVK